MEIRKTTLEEIDIVMDIYDNARQYMRRNGNMNQWINGYPQRELITGDILGGNSYVCVDGDRIEGVFTLVQDIDPTYLNIYEGSWLDDGPYGVIHRIAAVSHKKGIASYCLEWCLSKCKNIRIDTFRDNIPMQNLLAKNGFSRCGIIYLEDGAERLAYQKIIG